MSIPLNPKDALASSASSLTDSAAGAIPSLPSLPSVGDITSGLTDNLGGFADIKSLLAPGASPFQQTHRIITLELDTGRVAGEQLIPQTVSGTEALGEPYRFDILCLSPNAKIELKNLLGLPARLGILTATGSKFTRCGVITHAEAQSTDGGAAFYTLTFEPPLALLKFRYTNRVFQDKSVPEIVQTILDEHIAASPLFAANFAHRFDLSGEEDYPARSYCLQYRETDFAFIDRLLKEEGISYRFEHTEADNAPEEARDDDPDSKELTLAASSRPQPDDAGTHPLVTFVAFDDPASLPQASQPKIRFHRADATEADDVITDWTSERQLGVDRSTLESYEYKAVTTLVSDADSDTEQGELGLDAQSTLEDYDYQAPYYGDDADMERYARLRQQAHDRRKKTFYGAGTVRQIQVGDWFELTDHPLYSNRGQKVGEFVVERLSLVAYNNVPASDKAKAAEAPPPPFRITLQAQRRNLPLTPDYSHTRHAKPRANGRQTATVVGPVNGQEQAQTGSDQSVPMPDEVYTDAMGRIRIQFHWQRSNEHPEFGANLDEKSSCWIRVTYPSAGAGWGHQFIPRIGQEVIIDFTENDIDRPVVTSVVYNGAHPTPAFSGEGSLPANRALSGVKTKEHEGNQYGELLFDDTPNEVRTKLSSEHGKTQLNQGYLIYPRREGEGAPRGEGFEIRTDRHGAIRAGQGLFITTEASPQASGKQLDRRDAQAQLDSAWRIALEHANSAAAQEGDPAETGPEFLDEEGQPEGPTPSNPRGHIEHLVEATRAWESGTNVDPEGKSAPTGRPGRQKVLLASAPDGVGLTTDKELVLASQGNLDTITHRDTQQTTLKRWVHNVMKKISLFVGGEADKTSLKLTTAKGNALLYAQSNDVEIIGDENVRITANKENLLIRAEEEVILKCGGAFIQLKGGNIVFGSPGVQDFKAASYSESGPTSLVMTGPYAEIKPFSYAPPVDVDEIEAIILYPSLGTPQILASGASECSIIIATDVKGKGKLDTATTAAPFINRHLRLIALDADKFDQPPVAGAKLYPGIKDEYKQTEEDESKQFVEAKELTFYGDDLTLRMPTKEKGRSADVIGRLSPEALAFYGPSFSFFFEIKLKQIGSLGISAEPQSWAWIITTDRTHLAAEKDALDPDDLHNRQKRILAAENSTHQPVDRLVAIKMRAHTRQTETTTQGFLVDADKLYECEERDSTCTYRKAPHQRLQMWHPVMTKDKSVLKFGQLADIHISIRQAALALSKTCVIEGLTDEAPVHAKPVGERVAHAYRSFASLIDMMSTKADALLLTGDYIDFSRNISPDEVDVKNISKQWSVFNCFTQALKPGGKYKRGQDHVLFYTLLMDALRDKKLPAYLITGNHEGYQLPYGISPRVDDNKPTMIWDRVVGEGRNVPSNILNFPIKGINALLQKLNITPQLPEVPPAFDKMHPSNFSAVLDSWVNDEKQAWAALDKVKQAIAQKKRDIEKANQKQEDTTALKKEIEVLDKEHDKQQKSLEEASDKLREYHEGNTENASQWHQKRGCECIPSDHNLTIYEACLAFGPTYGQTLTTYNFRREQLDLIHAYFTPFTDFNAYPGATDLLGKGAQQSLSLLGWGGDERLLDTDGSIPGDLSTAIKAFNVQPGKDRRGAGFLPYATDSINAAQLALLGAAQKQKKPVWSVASHFTVAAYTDNVPLGANAGFEPDDTPQSISAWKTITGLDDLHAQYNVFNFGACELGLKTYLNQYTALGKPPVAGQVGMHFSGHSHRAGLYTMAHTPGFFGGEEDAVTIRAAEPVLNIGMGGLGNGTKFVVTSSAGSFGKQSLNYLDEETKTFTKADPIEGTGGRMKGFEFDSLLCGWLTRAPSGLLADTQARTVEPVVVPLGKLDEGNENRKPRLAVMLDYRDLVSMTDEKFQHNRPLRLCPPPKGLLGRVLDNDTFAGGLPVRVSKEAEALGCLVFEDVMVWAWEMTAPKAETEVSLDTQKKTIKEATGKWIECKATIEGSGQDRLLKFADGGTAIKGLVDGAKDKKLEAAFFGIMLKTPTAKIEGVNWAEEVKTGEYWVFPVDVGHGGRGDYVTRPDSGKPAEYGEVPRWKFLGENFSIKGYPPNKLDVINTPEKTAEEAAADTTKPEPKASASKPAPTPDLI